MLKVMMNLEWGSVEDKCEGKFSDLSALDWGCKYAEAALEAGYIAANAEFRPNDNVSKAEALKMIMQARGIEKYTTSVWQLGYVQAAIDAWILDNSFTDYNTNALRGWIFVIAANAINTNGDDICLLLCELDDSCEECPGYVAPSDQDTDWDWVVDTEDNCINVAKQIKLIKIMIEQVMLVKL
jgi:hypothetical protein